MDIKAEVVFGQEPTLVKSGVKATLEFNEDAGLKAYEKFKGLFGLDFQVGLVVHVPTKSPELIEGKINLKDMERIGKHKEFKTISNGSGWLGSMSFDISKQGLPEQFLGIKLRSPVTVRLDLESDKDFYDVAKFASSVSTGSEKIFASRSFCSLFSNMRGCMQLGLAETTILEGFAQVTEVVPVPLSVDPKLYSKIFENMELRLTFDSMDSLPAYFLDHFWNQQVVEFLKDFANNYIMNQSSGVFPEKEQMKILSEIGKSMEPKTLFIYLFSKNWGILTIEIHAPGFQSLMEIMDNSFYHSDSN